MLVARSLRTVLTIDDDDTFAFLIRRAFDKAGIQCELVFKTLVEEANQYLDDESNAFPDLILLDINLPGLSGWDFLDTYRERGYHLDRQSVIYVQSSSVYESDRAKANREEIVAGFIEKPFTKERLLEIERSHFQSTSNLDH